jgi:uncharacterized protein YecT (DUF1311 family)
MDFGLLCSYCDLVKDEKMLTAKDCSPTQISSKSMSQAISALLLFGAFVSDPVLAQTGGSYRDFVPTQAQINEAVSPAFIECVRLAGSNKSSFLNCANVEQSQADRRLNDSYRGYLNRLPAADARVLRIEQQAWLRARKNMCLSRVERMNTSDPWGELIKCGLQETIRRQIWIQTRV